MQICCRCKTTEGNARYMCDQEIDDDNVYCGRCFDVHPCGRGEYGEGCGTMIVYDQDETIVHGQTIS